MSTTATITTVMRPRRRRRGGLPYWTSGSGRSRSSPVITRGAFTVRGAMRSGRLQPRLEHHRRRDLVDDGSPVRPSHPGLVEAALGGHRGEPLVVRDHVEIRPGSGP